MELKIETRNVELRKSWQARIEEEKEKIVRHYANFILHLRVVVTATTHHKEGGFEIKLVAAVPNDTVVITKKGGSVLPLLVSVFDILSLKLKEILRKKRKGQKGGDPLAEGDTFGTIRKVSPRESYGFISTPDNRDIYFHENALKNIRIDDLTEGDTVIYGETPGDKGPQASWVKAVK